MEFFQNFRLEWNSFWLGVLAASLLGWLVRISRPWLVRLRQSFHSQTENIQHDRLLETEIGLRNETLRHAQKMHLAAPLFSLDEIILPARLLSSGLPPHTKDNLLTLDITERVIPDTPDWPQIASYYNWPTISIEAALGKQANLAITSQPGDGKSVALAHLASQLARREIEIQGIDTPVPLLTHVADLALSTSPPDNVLTPVFNALGNYLSQETISNLPALLEPILSEGRALLILDGLDELPPPEFDLVIDYLEHLQDAYPELRMVTTTSTGYWGRLQHIGFHILPLAIWQNQQSSQFIEKWGQLWKKYFSNPNSAQPLPDPDLIKGWLLTDCQTLTRLEMTCKTWAAFSGDALGSEPIDAIEAYLQRKLYNLTEAQRLALEQMAAYMILTQQSVAKKDLIENWLDSSNSSQDLKDAPHYDDFQLDLQKNLVSTERVRVRSTSAITAYLECGLLRNHPDDRYSIIHPVLTSYLAAKSCIDLTGNLPSDTHFAWDTRNMSIQFRLSSDDEGHWLSQSIKEYSNHLVPIDLLQISRWLPYAPKEAFWAQDVLRSLANQLHNPKWPTNIKARFVAALIRSGNHGVPILFRQLLKSPEQETCILSALGLGILRDAKAIPELTKLSSNKETNLAAASILSLVAIGKESALESVATILLHGSEFLRRCAAEALANDQEEGHAILKDASEMQDPAVRRAAVFGLGRVNQAWADQMIDNLQNKDTQWVVKDAADQVVALRDQPNPHIPEIIPPLNQTPWLIEFAASKGLGVAPGEPALQLLNSVLDDGNQKQKISALYALVRQADFKNALRIEGFLETDEPALRLAAYEAIYQSQLTGLS